LKKTLESVLMCYGWDCSWYAVQWKCHQALCQFLYDHQEGGKVPVPTKIRPEDTHPLKVFEKTDVEIHLYQWVVLVLWLKPHPSAWRWYRSIQKVHPHSVPTIQTLWDHCWKVWHLERQNES